MHSRFFIAIICVEDMKHYIEGFAQECYKQGLTEKQAYAALSVAMQKRAGLDDALYDLTGGADAKDIVWQKFIYRLLNLGKKLGVVKNLQPARVEDVPGTSWNDVMDYYDNQMNYWDELEDDYINTYERDENGDLISTDPNAHRSRAYRLARYAVDRAQGKFNRKKLALDAERRQLEEKARSRYGAPDYNMRLADINKRYAAAEKEFNDTVNNMASNLESKPNEMDNLAAKAVQQAEAQRQNARKYIALDDQSFLNKVTNIVQGRESLGDHWRAWRNRDKYDEALQLANKRMVENDRRISNAIASDKARAELGITPEIIKEVAEDVGMTVTRNKPAVEAPVPEPAPQPAPATQPPTPPINQPAPQPQVPEEEEPQV